MERHLTVVDWIFTTMVSIVCCFDNYYEDLVIIRFKAIYGLYH